MKSITSSKTVVVTSDAPAALGSYSQGIVNSNKTVLYTSGQIGLDPRSLRLVDGVEAQIRQTFSNIEGICKAAGASLESISKLTVFLVSQQDWAVVNLVMDDLFSKPFPARTAIGVVWLPLGAVVEIEATVDLSPSGS
ncbi:Rid family detoxifying hydrolase [Pseudomonas syringae]|nr:Rid family detoxifying hydrolase [Pseudomonas syringae]